MEFDGKSFQTKKINAVFELIDNETKQLRATKKDLPTDKSVLVAGEGIEPPTFGLWAQRATTAPPRTIFLFCDCKDTHFSRNDKTFHTKKFTLSAQDAISETDKVNRL